MPNIRAASLLVIVGWKPPLQNLRTLGFGGRALNACHAWMPYLPASAAAATARPARNGAA